VHSNLFSKCDPSVNGWHKGFVQLVDIAEEGHKLFPLARHVAADLGLTYPPRDQIDDSYIRNLETPNGRLDYEQIFDRAVRNIRFYWDVVSKAIFESGPTDAFLNWNLDTGKDPSGKYTAWSRL